MRLKRRLDPVPLGLGLAAFLLALLQRPGLDTSDTKIALHVDPGRFLDQVAAVWSQTGSLGHVQGGQYSGYLWPMGPFFALGRLLGVSDWLIERLWLGALLALAAWGVVRLLDALFDPDRGAAHLVAGALYMLNPYVVVNTSRTTAFLTAYAALPWLLLAAHRGLRAPRKKWWWAAAFALITASTGGGVNATVTAFVLLGPALLALYEYFAGGVPGRELAAFAWRTLAATVAVSLWWIAPLLVQSRFGLNFLPYTEHAGSIWSTTSLTESLRLMGYWPTYAGIGFSSTLTPYFGNATTMLFNPFVVAASLLVPGLAITGYAWSRRWRYGPFFLLMALIALLVMTVSWPDGTPGRRAFTFLYDHLTTLQFLRTTYKAGPLLALAIAALAGVAAHSLWRRTRTRAQRIAAPALAAALLVLPALPLFEGRAIELTWSSIPAAWRQAGHDLDRQLPANSRAVVLPGQAFAYYDWGATVDPILPTLTTRPVAVRNVPPFDDLHAVDLLWTVDDLVQQQRLLGGQLRPLLDLMSARAVITASDDNDAVSGALAPAPAAAELSTQPGFARPARSYGPTRTFAAATASADPAMRLPEVRRYDLPGRGLIRIEPQAPSTIVDGSADGLAGIAALGELTGPGPLFYAGDLSTSAIRQQVAQGAAIYITDSNRRRAFVASRVLQNYGWTVTAAEQFSADAALLDPFTSAGEAAQTVAVFEGARDVRAPYNPGIAGFPEHRPFAAFDGDPGTAWLGDPTLGPSSQWLELDLDAARDIPYLDLLPNQSHPLTVKGVTVNGRRFAIHSGWNRLAVGLVHTAAVRMLVSGLASTQRSGSPIGLAEVRIPGVHIRELLRPPVLAERALRGVDLGHNTLTYVFERTTAAAPLRRGPPQPQVLMGRTRLEQEAALIRQAQDPETGIDRRIDPPAARRWAVSALASVTPTAPDAALDRLAGTDVHGASFFSSGRLEGIPGDRASAAFDDSPKTAWVVPFTNGQPAWIAWTTPAAHTLRKLTLTPSRLPVRFPTTVSIGAATGSETTPPLHVGADGSVVLPRPIRARSFRLTVLSARGSDRQAVAIAELRGSGAPTVTEPQHDQVRGSCGDLFARLGSATIRLRINASVAAFDRGSALPVSACGAPVRLPAGPADLTIAPRAIRPLLVQLRSPAPAPLAHATGVAGGQLLEAGVEGNGSYSGVRVRVRTPSWLVLGESYNARWRASCNGRSLGNPQVIDAFANGWPVRPGCRSVLLRFGPQTYVDIGYLLGALAAALLVLVLALSRPGAPAGARPAPRPPDLPVRPWAVLPAILAGVLVGAAFGFLFGLRAGVVIGPAVAFISWRGIRTETLVLAAAALLVIIVPIVYLAFQGTNQGGYDADYANQHLAANWVAVGAFALLTLALVRSLQGPGGTARGRWVSTATDPRVADQARSRPGEGR